LPTPASELVDEARQLGAAAEHRQLVAVLRAGVLVRPQDAVGGDRPALALELQRLQRLGLEALARAALDRAVDEHRSGRRLGHQPR
jgi:hypothetical protein